MDDCLQMNAVPAMCGLFVACDRGHALHDYLLSYCSKYRSNYSRIESFVSLMFGRKSGAEPRERGSIPGSEIKEYMSCHW